MNKQQDILVIDYLAAELALEEQRKMRREAKRIRMTKLVNDIRKANPMFLQPEPVVDFLGD